MFKLVLKNSYSILELTIVLTILGFITATVANLLPSKAENEKISDTVNKMEYIEKAISYYFAEYGSIPCPADPKIKVNDNQFGISNRSPSVAYNCNNDYQNAGISIGSIPTATLQISDDYTYDAWGRRFSYAIVSQCNTSPWQYLPGYGISLVSNVNYNSTNCANNTTGLIIQDGVGNTITSNAIYVILSHGKNGHGAYPKNNYSTTGMVYSQNNLVGSNEIKNSLINASNVSKLITNYVQQPISNSATSYFDDILHYRTKSQIIKESRIFDSTNGKYSNYICNLSSYIPNQATALSNYCNSSNPNVLYMQCQTILYQLAFQIQSLCY